MRRALAVALIKPATTTAGTAITLTGPATRHRSTEAMQIPGVPGAKTPPPSATPRSITARQQMAIHGPAQLAPTAA